jgi:probable HAF family extracellular repeat protein
MRNSSVRTAVLTLLAVLTAMVCVAATQAQTQTKPCVAEHYTLVPLPLHPTHINDRGEIAGTTPTRRAALWSQATGLRVATVPDGYTMAEGTGLNNAGHMVGVASNEDGSKRQAFAVINNKTILLPETQSKASFINDNDEIAGESTVPGKAATSPVIWRDRHVVDLGACCGGTAFALNSKGKVVGQSYDADGQYHAFSWDATNGMKKIGLAEDNSATLDINDAGHMIIQAFPHNYLFEDGKLTALELSSKYPSQPRALNNCDVIVGSFGKHFDDSKAFVWDKSHGFVDLNERIAANKGWKLEGASSINKRGEIVGWGDFNGEEDQGFLLVPQW